MIIFVLPLYNRGGIVMFLYVNGFGGYYAYGSLSDYIRSERFVEMGVSERTLRGFFAEVGNVRYENKSLPSRFLLKMEVEKMVRKKVRPKYLFGKEY